VCCRQDGGRTPARFNRILNRSRRVAHQNVRAVGASPSPASWDGLGEGTTANLGKDIRRDSLYQATLVLLPSFHLAGEGGEERLDTPSGAYSRYRMRRGHERTLAVKPGVPRHRS
jgi:hypothetical protein